MRTRSQTETKPSPESVEPSPAPAGADPRIALLREAGVLEDLQRFSHATERARAVHTKGCGAFGTFTVTHDITRLCCAGLFGAVGRRTDVLARFSMMRGERGSADAERDIRGFSVRFFTDEGNWDLVGTHLPVSWVRDPGKFVPLMQSFGRDPQGDLHDPNARWDFLSQNPETLHLLTMLYSDRGIPAGYRFMSGFGVHAFSLLSAGGERVWCKFHLLSLQGSRTLTDQDAAARIGDDRDAAQRDLLEAIARGEFPKWRLCVQCMSSADAEALRWNPFDATKVWPHATYPLVPIGELELNRNASSHREEIEQAAFRPSAFVRGIEPSPDPLLRARLLSYADAQFHRLGPEHERSEVNASRCPVRSVLRGAASLLTPTATTPSPAQARSDAAWARGEAIAARFAAATDHDDCAQPGALFRMLDERHRERLTARMARSLAQAALSVQMRQIALLLRADDEYGTRVAQRLGLDASQLATSRPRVSTSTLMTSGAD